MKLPDVIVSEAVPPGTVLAVSGLALDESKVHLAAEPGATAGLLLCRWICEAGALRFRSAAKLEGGKEG